MKNEYLAMIISQPDFVWPLNTPVLYIRQIGTNKIIGYMLQDFMFVPNTLEIVLQVMEEKCPNEYNDMLTAALAYTCGRLFNEESTSQEF